MAEMTSWAVGSDTDRVLDVEDARAATAALLSANGVANVHTGFLATTGSPGLVSAAATPNATVTVSSMRYVMPNSRGTNPYLCMLNGTKTLDVLVSNPADPTNVRNDLIIAQQNDPFYGDANSNFEVKRITGTPAASPSDPTVTGSPDYVLLARIRVAANATTITNAMIDDLRSLSLRVVARGGVIPCTSAARPANPYHGMVIAESDTGKMLVRNTTTGAWEEIYTAVSGQLTTALPIRTTNTGDVSLSSTAHAFQIGPTSGVNFRLDNEEMQAVNNGAASILRINPLGGLTQFGTGGIDVDGTATIDGAATISNTATITPTTGSGSKPLAFNHSYAVWVDNVAADGTTGTRMWIDTPNDGDVVIGPRAGSDFINQLRFRTDSTTGLAGNLYMNPTTYTVSRSTSSLRYKTDITDLTLDLDAVRSLRPVRYRDKREVEHDHDTEQTYIGFIAEEVDALGLSDFVHYQDDPETGERRPDGLQYDRFTVAHHIIISELEATVAAQSGEIARLAERLAALESKE